jgi:hypothetical protein
MGALHGEIDSVEEFAEKYRVCLAFSCSEFLVGGGT